MKNLCKENANKKEKISCEYSENIDQDIHGTYFEANRTEETTVNIDKELQLESEIPCVGCEEESADYIKINKTERLVERNYEVKNNSEQIKRFMWFDNIKTIKVRNIDIRQIIWSKSYLDFINCKMKM